MRKNVFLPKSTFTFLFTLLVMALILLPFITTFDEILTSLFLKFSLYRHLQSVVVPFEIKMVVVILRFLGLEARGSLDTILLGRGLDSRFFAGYLSWNCIGWQSLILFILSLFTGLQGNFTKSSKFEAAIIGFLGTFFLNIFRIALVFVFAYYFGQLPAVIFHNYAGTIMTIIWLFFFWWFSYSFVLEEKKLLVGKEVVKV